MLTTTRLLPLLGVLGILGPASAQDVRPHGPWQAQTTRRGDTTIVRTLRGSVWSEQVRLVEELRIGTRDGDGPDAFGDIWAFALFANGVMAVFDASVPALRLFRPTGQYIQTLGRDGAGPGEYRSDVRDLAVDRNGTLIMYDRRNVRLNRWKADGTMLPAWRLGFSPTIYTMYHGLQVDTAGNSYILTNAERLVDPARPPKQALARLDRTGRLVDTVVQPEFEGPDDPATRPFSPYKHWLLNRRGQIAGGHSGRYSITIAGAGGKAVRIERVVPQVRLLPEERRNYGEWDEARSQAAQRTGARVAGNPAASLPEVKPVFQVLHSDLDGRIWVKLYTQAERYDPPAEAPRPATPQLPPIRWRERVVWDVFATDGRYLGQLELPHRTIFAEAKGSNVWAIQRGEDDEQYIIRYRITGMRQAQ